MIRLRSAEGKIYKLPDNVKFVEICDTEGKLAALVFTNEQGIIRVLTPEHADFQRYVTIYKATVTKVIEA